MEITSFEKEFVERTKKILLSDQYKECEYDVTLLLNCMLGLVSLPIEKASDNKKETERFRKRFQYQFRKRLINLATIEESKNKFKTFKAIKNALSHMNIELGSDENKISRVIFMDINPKKTEEGVHTKITFEVDKLREFALFVADLHLQKY